MKVSDYQTQVAYGNVRLHHSSREHGPHDMCLGVRGRPEIIQKWGRLPVRFSVAQPNELDNFTMMHFLFLKSGSRTPSFARGLKFRNIRQYRTKRGVMRLSIKTRYTHSLPHPVPMGRYDGTVTYDDAQTFAVVTFQALTLRKEPEPLKPRTIITPEDKRFGESLRDIKRIVR